MSIGAVDRAVGPERAGRSAILVSNGELAVLGARVTETIPSDPMLTPWIVPSPVDAVPADPLTPPAPDAAARTLEDWAARATPGPGEVESRRVGDGAAVVEIDHPGGALVLGPLTDVVLGVWQTRADVVVADFGAGPTRTRCHVGALFMLPAGARLSLSVPRRHRLRLLGLPAAQVAVRLAELDERARAQRLAPLVSRIFELPTTAALVGRVWEIAGRDEPAARRFLDSAIATILWDLSNADVAHAERRPKGGLAPWQLAKVTDYILEHLDADVGLDDLAALLDLSPFHFCRAFRISTGQPPHRWRLNKRMALAQELLSTTRLPVTAIAARVGYEDATNFSSAFRRATGRTPARWRADTTR